MNDFKAQLEQKRVLLKSVLELTRLQTGLIEADDTDALLSNIADRQKLIDKVDSIQAELPDRETLRADKECLALISEVNAVLDAIQEQDAANERAALTRMEQLRTQMRKVNEGRKTYSGYEATGVNQIGGLYINKTK